MTRRKQSRERGVGRVHGIVGALALLAALAAPTASLLALQGSGGLPCRNAGAFCEGTCSNNNICHNHGEYTPCHCEFDIP
ncbi:MAG: hypothetical protein KatS3mg015_1523 [Fimbriimonadales bacterium]|nr:MAG: hypothetical protein KatS3mg015_1523 [Fimbriimonadales bacterium]